MHPTSTRSYLRYAAAAAAALVVLTAVAALLGGPLRNDRMITRTVVGHRSDVLTSAAHLVSNIFSPVTTVVFAIVAAGVFVWRDRSVARGAAVLAGVGGAAVVAEILKLVVDRRRPPFAVQLEAHEAAQSFPSGHVTGTTALVVGLALLAVPAASRSVRCASVAVAALIVVASAASRVYLGMHWTSDVVAGALLGLCGALAAPTAVARMAAVVDGRLFRQRAAAPPR